MMVRLLRSLRNTGVRGTVESCLAVLEDGAFDVRNRTDTHRTIDLSDLAIPEPNKLPGYRYEASRARALRSVLSTCEFPPASVFVDLGCGKGRAMLVASQFAFKRVVGVEVSRELCDIAAANVRTYRKRHRDAAPVDIIEADAVGYEVKPDENVFYLFNPFGRDMLRQVVRNISSSVASHRRPVWIIYNDPRCAGEIESSGAFVHLRTVTYGANTFAVYASRTAEPGTTDAH